MNLQKISLSAAVLSGCVVFSAEPALAYLDPGTGSMMLQAIIAGFAAVSVTVGIFWQRIKAFFNNKKNSDEVSDSNEK